MCNAWNHPPDCTCGWGGPGHSGVSGHSSRVVHSSYASDFCRCTTCPRCRANVYFIRHNGGSVYVDSLGVPWPRHGCFAQTAEYDSLHALRAHVGGNTNEVWLAIVLQADRLAKQTQLSLKEQAGRIFHVRVPGDRLSLAGELVLVSRRKRIIHALRLGREVVAFVDLDGVVELGQTVCPVCGKSRNGLADHMRSKHPNVPYDPNDRVVRIPWHKPEVVTVSGEKKSAPQRPEPARPSPAKSALPRVVQRGEQSDKSIQPFRRQVSGSSGEQSDSRPPWQPQIVAPGKDGVWRHQVSEQNTQQRHVDDDGEEADFD